MRTFILKMYIRKANKFYKKASNNWENINSEAKKIYSELNTDDKIPKIK